MMNMRAINIIGIFCIIVAMIVGVIAGNDYYNLSAKFNILEDNYNILRYNNNEMTNEQYDLIRENHELKINNTELKWENYLLEKQIPLYVKYLNNTNDYTSCWIENGTKLDIRKEDCYNCENFTNDYLDSIKDGEYEIYYVSGRKEGHVLRHAFVKVCEYINPTVNRKIPMDEFMTYKNVKCKKM